MICGSCGAPLAKSIPNCPFCGASTKFALTEQGQLPYEAALADASEKKLEPPEPRWDLEAPQGTSHSRWQALRGKYSIWAAMERRRFVARGGRGCLATGATFLIIVTACAWLSIVESRAYQHLLALTPVPTLSASAMTATAATYPNPYLPHTGLMTLNDPLIDNNSSNAWMDYTADQTFTNQGCAFQNNSYSTSKPTRHTSELHYCLAVNTNFQNFTYQIDMANVSGQSGGIIFRQDIPDKFYYFSIDIDGSYTLWLNAGESGRILAHGSSSAIHRGHQQINTLAVVANGSNIDLYVNSAHLTAVSDATYRAGRIGTAVGAPDSEATECLFNNAEVWVL